MSSRRGESADRELADQPMSWPVASTADLHRDDWVVALRSDQVSRPGHQDETFRRLVIEDPGAVLVLAIDDEERVVILRQYRHPVQRELVQLPAGVLDEPGEEPLEAAKRELREEAAVEAGRWRHLLTTYATAGKSQETHAIFLARDLRDVERGFELHHEEAEMTLARVPVTDLIDAVLDHRVQDAPLATAVLAYDALVRREAVSITSLLAKHPVIDGHNDLLMAARMLVGYDWDRLDLADTDLCRALGTHTDLPRMTEGGLGAQFWSVFVPSTLTGEAAVIATLEQVDGAYSMIRRYADRLVLATTAADVETAWASGRIASLLGAEGGHQIGGSLGTLRMLHRLGVRYLTLTHNDNVAWADSATDEPLLGGLSEFGEQVVAEMNRLGMLVDLSHVSADVMRHALRITTSPVIFSHSSARSVCDHERNVPDDVLAGLAVNGGVCMVTFVPRFVTQAVRDWDLVTQGEARSRGVDPKDYLAYSAFTAEHSRSNPPPPSTLEDVVAHVEHVREVAGIEHVGLGGDYDGVAWQPQGLEDVSGYPRLLAALAERGWSTSDLAALTCRNTLRVLADNGS